jgi:type VI secretion system protein VasJ
MSLAEDPRAALGAVAIPGDAPAGVNLRYEPEFDALQTEIGKMETAGPNAVKWRDVVTMASDITEKRSKDLLVGVWLAFALWREESYKGLGVGLAILRDMIDKYWADMQPPAKRERARIGPVEWLCQKLAPAVTDPAPGPGTEQAVIEAWEALDAIDRLLDEKLQKEKAALGELIRPLRSHAQSARQTLKEAEEKAKAPPPAPPPPPPPPAAATDAAVTAPAAPAPAAAAPVAAPPAAPVATVAAPAAPAAGTPSELTKGLDQLQGSMRSFAQALQAANPADPRAYALLREATWLTISQPPPVQGGKTPLPPVPPDRIAGYVAMQQNNQHLEMVAAVEKSFAFAPFWLDAHRLVASSLGALGQTYKGARDAVVGSLAGFLIRFPDLPEMSFNSGQTFADGQTKQWIKAEVLVGSGGGGAPDTPWDLGDHAARELAMKGKIPDGLGVFTAGARAAAGSARFRWQIAQARFCLDFGQAGLAVPLLDHMLATADRADLESWEPELVASAAELMFRCLSHPDALKVRPEPERQAMLAQARARLARLDMAAAAKLPK